MLYDGKEELIKIVLLKVRSIPLVGTMFYLNK